MEVFPGEINNSLCKLLPIQELLATGRPINSRAWGVCSFYTMTMSLCWWPASMVNIDYPAGSESKEWMAGCWIGLFDWWNICWMVNGVIKLPTVVPIGVAVNSPCPPGQNEMFNAMYHKCLVDYGRRKYNRDRLWASMFAWKKHRVCESICKCPLGTSRQWIGNSICSINSKFTYWLSNPSIKHLRSCSLSL